MGPSVSWVWIIIGPPMSNSWPLYNGPPSTSDGLWPLKYFQAQQGRYCQTGPRHHKPNEAVSIYPLPIGLNLLKAQSGRLMKLLRPNRAHHFLWALLNCRKPEMFLLFYYYMYIKQYSSPNFVANRFRPLDFFLLQLLIVATETCHN